MNKSLLIMYCVLYSSILYCSGQYRSYSFQPSSDTICFFQFQVEPGDGVIHYKPVRDDNHRVDGMDRVMGFITEDACISERNAQFLVQYDDGVRKAVPFGSFDEAVKDLYANGVRVGSVTSVHDSIKE